METNSSSKEAPSMETNSEMEDTSSSTSQRSEANSGICPSHSSGDESATQEGQRIVGDRFQYSSETINRHVKTVMRALHQLERTVIRRTKTDGVHPYITKNPHNYPWFEKCLGAMDNTMIDAAAPSRLSNAYRNHRGRIAQNVLCLCDFNMKFTYVYTGWEGTAHDARVFLDALSRRYYYLVDFAFPCIEKFMPPYPRERYHQSDRYSGRQFRGYKDYFNFCHSSLHNIIERTFELLKNRFQILNAMPRYRPTRQGMLVTACCTLHNLIRTVTPNDEFIQAALALQFSEENTTGNSEVVDMSHESAEAMASQRDAIAILCGKVGLENERVEVYFKTVYGFVIFR
ncbi:hypothetical protein F2P56_011448 [Juglans regia]|uniref:Uncharacterized protein LOC109021457 n=2 Tax=Juglans regia TaxID=51240 RepID=A0A2I4HTZ3_JUGRE|nr:uncharacterized protein LOC109021457 [Juglans regia]KAF5470966.1 hypothetical protein F2P56_011448 [Juglans regia]